MLIHLCAGLLGESGDTYPWLTTQARDYVARMTTPPDDTRKALIDALFDALINSGGNNPWQYMDAAYLMAVHAGQAGLLNICGNSAYDLVAPSTAPTFTTDRGYAGNGVDAYFRTNYDPSAATLLYTLNSCHIAVYARTDGGTHVSSADQESRLRVRSTTNATNFRMNGDGRTWDTGKTLPYLGVVDRTGTPPANSIRLYAEDDVINSFDDPAVAISNEFEIFRQGSTYSTSEIAFVSFGGDLGTAAENILADALQTYMTAVGAD